MGSTLDRIKKVSFIFFLAILIGLSLIWMFEDDFDANQWRSKPDERYKMANDIIEHNLLGEKSKEEIIQILGIPRTSDSNTLIYDLGTPPSFFDSEPQRLVIKLRDEKVVRVTVVQD
ncbi:hypothetical protein [Winogradskyella alexanderae]|uniref:Outer membrane protein assembly factor BamE n=1 Tax=Winogradskyella alexanderae TaxID=2877123 RepID=A0ABS7XNF0_9FLAO|nr:hypothetical protein [Winogradskyella alexanderae]MCA0131532.1 hypothetical protein [Winogradskyella alexanderae]